MAIRLLGEVMKSVLNITLRVGSKGLGDNAWLLALIIISIVPITPNDIAQFSFERPPAQNDSSYHKCSALAI